jgi:hypothetical protein
MKTVSLFPLCKLKRLFFFALLLVTCVVHPTHALEFVSTNGLVFDPATVQTQEIWALSDTITGGTTFANDAFMMAQRLDITGHYHQDLWAIGNAVSFTGTCSGHVRMLAASTRVSAEVADNVIAIATSVEVTRESLFRGNAFLGGQNTICEGAIEGDLTMYAGRATLSGTVKGDVLIVADDIVVMPNTQVGGDLQYISNSDLVLNASVTVGGELLRREITQLPESQQTGSFSSRIIMQAYLYLGALLTGALWLFIAPRMAGSAIGVMRLSLLKCFLVGALVLVVVPSVSILLFLSMVGIPLTVLLLCTYACMIYIAKILSAFFIGLLIFRRHQNAGGYNSYFIALSTGLLVIYGLALLPSAMLFIWLITTCTGLGAMVLALLRMRKENDLVISIAGNAIEQARQELENEPDAHHDTPHEQ